MITRVLVLGASGDLTTRYLMPALTSLHARGELPEGFSVHGMARTDWSSDEFRGVVADSLEQHAPQLDEAARDAALASTTYRAGDVTNAADLRAALGDGDEPVAIYLALPPAIVEPSLRAIIEASPPVGSRVALEKPFGEDLESAQQLNALLHAAFAESALFRVDHFLAEPAVQNLLGLRFANRLLETVWSHKHIERVEITWDETLALEGRAAYYDSAGALRDMIQNHLLQVLCFVAMEPPRSLNERDLRDRKLDVLRAVHRLTPDEVDRKTVRARYTSGELDGHAVLSYADEEGVEPDRGTETFAQIELSIENERWADVPFVLRSGKALARDRSEIAVYFRPPLHSPFDAETAPEGNVLRMCFDPASVSFTLSMNGSGDSSTLEMRNLTGTLPRPDLPPYAYLLRAILHGETALSVRDDEAEESWRVVEPILEAWRTGRSPLRTYQAGLAPFDWESSRRPG